jgi:lipoprotein-releasing system permease protein
MKFYELFIAFRYIRSNKRQSLIITLAISIGVALIVWIPSMNLSFFGDLIDKSVSSAPNITLTKETETFKSNQPILNFFFADKSLLLKDQVQTRKRNIKVYSDVINQIKNVPGIEEMAPYLSGQAFIIKGAEERGVQLKGIIPDEEVNITNIENNMTEGNIRNLGINDIVIGSILSEKINVAIGDKVTITGPRGTSKDLRITGIFSTGLRGNDEFQVYITLKSAQQILQLGNDVTGIGVRVTDIYQAENISQKLKEITGLYVRSWMEENKQILDQINRFRLIISFINFLIISSAASSITSVFIMLIASKSKEIGILKSIGAKNSSVMVIFLSQAVFLSILGYFIGLLFAKLLLIWYAGIIQSAGETLFTSGVPEFKINFFYAFMAFVYSIFTSILASILPSYQAAKLNPVEAINA